MSRFKSEKAEKRYKDYQKQYYLENKEKLLAANKKWKEENKERHKENRDEYYRKNKDTMNEAFKKDRKENPVKYSIYKLANRHKIYLSEEKVAELINSYTGLCEICGEEESVTHEGKPTSLCVDHCHETLAIRGFLCRRCNTGIGYFRDNEEFLQNAAKYIIKSKEK